MERKKGDEKEEAIETSLIVDENSIAEIVYDGKKTKFCYYKKGKFEPEYVDRLIIDGIEHKPFDARNHEEIEKGGIILPDKVASYLNTEELDKEIETFLRKYLEVEEEMYFYLTSYVRFSWVFDKFRTLNYLKFQGDTGAGKSRALDTVGVLCYKTIFTSGATTTAPIFRTINKWRGTVIIDESDMPKGSDETNALVKIINQGFEKNRFVMRCDENNREKIKYFDVYCPKLIGSRKSFDDKAVEARCITTIMQQTSRKDIPVTLPNSFFEESKILRRKLLMYRLKNYFTIDPDKGLEKDLSEIEPRLRQVNSNFVGLFAQSDEQFYRFKKFLIKLNKRLIIERCDSFDGTIIQALAEVIVNTENGKNEPITTGLVSEMMREKFDVDQKFSDPRIVGKHLKSFGIVSKPVKISGHTVRVLKFDFSVFIDKIVPRYILDDDLIKRLHELHIKKTEKELILNSDDKKLQELHELHHTGRTKNQELDKKSNGLHQKGHPVCDVTDVTNVTKESVLEQIELLLNVVKPIPIDMLIKNCKNAKMDEVRVEECIEALKKKGEIYEPKAGYLGMLV